MDFVWKKSELVVRRLHHLIFNIRTIGKEKFLFGGCFSFPLCEWMSAIVIVSVSEIVLFISGSFRSVDIVSEARID